MNKFIKFQSASIVIIMATMAFSSCKKSFDNPPAEFAPASITANTTIQQLKARHTVTGAIDKVDSGTDIIISGIVIGDDRSGNLYKQIIIQDSTGGIAVNIGGNNLYTSYPIGRQLFIKCNGLYLGDYNGTMQLGGGIQTGSAPGLADIASGTMDSYITKGTLGNVVVPKDVTASTLTTTMQDKYINTLIRLSNYEFASGDLGKTYASPGVSSPSAASFNLTTCADLSKPSTDPKVELYNSNYADFAGYKVPGGNGTITAIYTIYKTFKQLTIRDTLDLKFTGGRCGTGTSSGGGGGTGGGTGLLSENFDSYSTSTTVPFAGTGWQNISSPTENATKYFVAGIGTSANHFAKISAFNSTQVASSAITSWLITPAINLTGITAPKLSFSTSANYSTGTLKILVSTNYNSANPPASATWTDITSSATLPVLPVTAFTAFIPSGSISLSAYAGQTIYIAYKYDVPAGTAKAAIATYEIDNVVVN